MTTAATVPITVTPEAAARIAELGFQGHIDRMIDYARRNLPQLTHIEVVLYDRYELGDEPGLAIEAYTSRPFDPADQTENDMDRWVVSAFPPEVLWHLIMSYRPGAPYAG